MVVLSDENTQIENRLDRNDNEDKIRIKRQNDLRILIEEAIGDCQNVKDEIDEIVRQLDKEVFQDDIKTIKDEINDKISELNDNNNELSNILNELFDLFYKVYNETEEEIREKINSAKDKISSIMKLTEEIFQETKNKIKKAREEFNKIKNKDYKDLTDFLNKHPKLKKNIPNYIPPFISSWLIGEFYNNSLYDKVQKTYGKNTAGTLDLAHSKMNNPDYVKDTKKLKNYDDENISKYRNYLKDKIEKQFESYKKINSKEIDGYYFKPYSIPSTDLAHTKEIRDFIKKYKEEIKEGYDAVKKSAKQKEKKNVPSIEFPTGEWYYSVHYADIIDCYFDDNGDLHIILFDTYDFNAGENKLVQAGRKAMKRGALKPRFLIWDILIKKTDFDKI